MYTRGAHTHVYIYIFGYTYRTSPQGGHGYTRGPSASDCSHMCARMRASAVPPRTTGRAASMPRRARAPQCAPPGREAAHTWDNVVTAAVFHAPMFALKADAELNACAPKPHAVDADGQGLARFRVSGFGPSPQHEPANACAQPIHPHRTLVNTYITLANSPIYR